jgi:hypothetical protein
MAQEQRPVRVITDDLIKEMSNNLIADGGSQCERLCDELRNLFSQLEDANPPRSQILMIMIKAIQAQRTALECPECLLI